MPSYLHLAFIGSLNAEQCPYICFSAPKFFFTSESHETICRNLVKYSQRSSQVVFSSCIYRNRNPCVWPYWNSESQGPKRSVMGIGAEGVRGVMFAERPQPTTVRAGTWKNVAYQSKLDIACRSGGGHGIKFIRVPCTAK